MLPLPSVTVIMAVRNEASFIAASLGAVLEQDYPADRLDVIVADGMSTDGTRAIIDRVRAARADIAVTVVDNPGRITPTGLNAAVAASTGEIVVRVDGHTVIASNYVRQCVGALIRTGADNVGGRMDAVSDGFFGRAVALATSSRFGVGGARFHYSTQEEWVDTVYLGAWPRAVFDRFGLFDEELVRNQDDEFNYRLLDRGGRILLSPAIASRYSNRTSGRNLWRQYFEYGYWKVRVMQKHPRQIRMRQLAPPAFVASLLMVAAAALLEPVAAWILIGVAVTYVVSGLVAAWLVQHSRRAGMMLVLPATFAIMHIAYGLGVLVGLVRFGQGWRLEGTRRHARRPREGAERADTQIFATKRGIG